MASRSDLNGKRVLVTGASGFTGRYVSDELKNLGCEVLGLGGSDHPHRTGLAAWPLSTVIIKSTCSIRMPCVRC